MTPKRFLRMAGLLMLAAVTGCGASGSSTESEADTINERTLSAVVTVRPDPALLRPPAFVPRDRFSRTARIEDLAFPLEGDEAKAFSNGLNFFITPQAVELGAGPQANQTRCLGCHMNGAEAAPDVPIQFATPVNRAARSGPTDFRIVGTGVPPEAEPHVSMFGASAAFTVYGDFDEDTGEFNPLEDFGGPLQQLRPRFPECNPEFVLPLELDPFLAGLDVDPFFGVQTTSLRRTLGDRAAPPYTGRGLIEAVHPDTIRSGDDPDDLAVHLSSLVPAATTNPECPGDCISGRANFNVEAPAFLGGDPLLRVGRFGLRSQGVGLFEFISAGGVSAQLGFTSPFNPDESPNPQNNASPACRGADAIPDPELRDVEVLDVRTLIRLLGIPALDACLLGTSDTCGSGATRVDVERGAALFGVDVDAFRSRMIPGRTPVGDPNAINQADRQLNCVGCHVPILATGGSPAEIGARHLSQRWIPIFSDLLMHDMGEVVPERRLPIQPPPFEVDGTFDISRNLADDVIGGQGLAGGREWRTPPLFGIGVIGPPFLHDARVYLSTRSVLPASTVYTNADVGTNARLVVNTFDDALRATIELHDLPPPDDATTPVGEGCAAFVAPRVRDEVCPPDLGSPSRTEARNVMRRWRALTDAEQQLVLDFLRAI